MAVPFDPVTAALVDRLFGIDKHKRMSNNVLVAEAFGLVVGDRQVLSLCDLTLCLGVPRLARMLRDGKSK